MKTFHDRIDFTQISKVEQELELMKKLSRDFVISTQSLASSPDGLLVKSEFLMNVTDKEGKRTIFSEWSEAESYADSIGGKIETCRDYSVPMPMSNHALSQLIGRLEIPMSYYQKLVQMGGFYSGLAHHNVTELLYHKKDKFLVRATYHTPRNPDAKGLRVRSIMSSSYRTLDNYDLFWVAAKKLNDMGAKIVKARVADDGRHFDLTAAHPDICAVVSKERGNGEHKWLRQFNDASEDCQRACVTVSNSETGEGGLNVKFGILTDICLNTSVVGRLVKAIHVGEKRKDEGMVFSQRIQEKENEIVWMKVKEAIEFSFNADNFKSAIDAMNKLTKIEATEERVDKIIKVATSTCPISEDERKSILAEMLRSGDNTAYGLLQAITQQAHTADAVRASQYEEMGGRVIEAVASGQLILA